MSYLVKLFRATEEENRLVILTLLDRQPAARLLDLGCYHGEWTMRLAQQIGTQQITGVEVVLTHDLAELSGSAADSSVLVCPDDLARYRDVRRVARWVRANQAGHFVVDDLLPGTYCVVATDQVDDAQWANLDYLEQFRAQATRVTLKAGDRQSLVLRSDANP